MGRGRPGKGLGHVDQVEGSAETKARLKAILETVSGTLTVREAARRLGVSEARFHELRRDALQQWADVLAPRPPGRPPKQEEIEPGEVEQLREQVKELQLDLQVARARTELALTMPHVLKEGPEAGAGKKGAVKRRRTGGKPTWFDDTTKAT
jgi:hypothetical protein